MHLHHLDSPGDVVHKLLLALELPTLLFKFSRGVLDVEDVVKVWAQVHGPVTKVNVSNIKNTASEINLAMSWRLFWV